MRSRRISVVLAALVLNGWPAALYAQRVIQHRSAAAAWPMYNRDYAGTRYSPLSQITRRNVSGLQLAWMYRFNRVGRPRISGPSAFELYQEITPIVVNDVLYMPSGDRVVALHPETGKEIWVHEVDKGLASFRGVSYWPGNNRVPARIFFTSLNKLIALNASNGTRARGFGEDGEITLQVPYSGAPTIYRNRIIIGANFFGPGQTHIGPQLTQPRGGNGDPRAFDAVTGKKVWEYHAIPGPGEPGHGTWGKGSWRKRTGDNVWAFSFTIDPKAGLVYMPINGPGANYYGGDRPGNNEPSGSVVALDAMTGKLQWYFQIIHHGLWDYDLPPAPSLINLDIDGSSIPALAQTGKVGWMFILNRLTGKPVFGVKEKPVPAGNVPGEWYAPTQPIPDKPPALARVGFNANTDIVTAQQTNAAHAKACRKLWKRVGYYNAGPYTPMNLKKPGTPPSLTFPGVTGGVNWGGTAVDPKHGYIFVHSKDQPTVGWMVPNPKYNAKTAYDQEPYIRAAGPSFAASRGDGTDGTWPCYAPPWARLMAIDGNTGNIVWSVPLGIDTTMPKGKQHVGSPGYGGPIVTAGGLVFIGATSDRRFRAFDSRTGKELWSYALPHNVTAVPISYAGSGGRQYVAVVAARGGRPGGEGLYVFALDNE